MGLYAMIERLCAVADEFGEDICSQWGDAAIVIEPGMDPFSVYRDTVAQETDGSLDEDPIA